MNSIENGSMNSGIETIYSPEEVKDKFDEILSQLNDMETNPGKYANKVKDGNWSEFIHDLKRDLQTLQNSVEINGSSHEE
jgi:hypothetical protein